MTGPAFERKFPPAPAEVAPARGALRTWLQTLADLEEQELDDILVVASELITNGVYHDGGNDITVNVERHLAGVNIAVTTVEHAPGHEPRYRGIVDPLERGRGLDIVRALSDGFSVDMHGDRRSTSCRVAIA
ncbi:MAG: ATP-binding protein [Acidimicrobiales bacterium]